MLVCLNPLGYILSSVRPIILPKTEPLSFMILKLTIVEIWDTALKKVHPEKSYLGHFFIAAACYQTPLTNESFAMIHT